MLMQIVIPDVVDMGNALQAMIVQVAGMVVIAAGGALAFMVIRKSLRRIEEYSECDYAYDQWKHAENQRNLSYDDAEAYAYWREQEAYWSDRHDQLSR